MLVIYEEKPRKGYGKIFQFIIDSMFVSGFRYLVSFEQIIGHVERVEIKKKKIIKPIVSALDVCSADL